MHWHVLQMHLALHTPVWYRTQHLQPLTPLVRTSSRQQVPAKASLRPLLPDARPIPNPYTHHNTLLLTQAFTQACAGMRSAAAFPSCCTPAPLPCHLSCPAAPSCVPQQQRPSSRAGMQHRPWPGPLCLCLPACCQLPWWWPWKQACTAAQRNASRVKQSHQPGARAAHPLGFDPTCELAGSMTPPTRCMPACAGPRCPARAGKVHDGHMIIDMHS